MNLQEQVLKTMMEKQITRPTHYEFLTEIIKDELPAFKEDSIRRAIRKLGEKGFLNHVPGKALYSVKKFMLTSVRVE